MMFPTSISEYFKMSSQTPVIGVGAISTTAKIGIAALSGVMGGLILGGAKQYLEQKQTGQISGSPTTYNFPTAKDVTLNYPTGASVKQDQTATQSTPDYLQWILIGGIALAGLYIFTKKKR